MAAGAGGAGGHLHWLNYEDAIYRTLEYQYWENEAGVIPLGHYYEFGLGAGRTFSVAYRTIRELAKDLGCTSGNQLGVCMYGFDSFEGLPEIREGDPRIDWQKGSMKFSREEFQQHMDGQRIPRDAYEVVEGFFHESLTYALRERLSTRKPGLVLMDCGVYSSTITALEWLRPMLRDGTFFIFVNTWAYMGHPDLGEIRAIREFNAKGVGMLVPHYLGGATQQLYVFTSGYQAAAYKEYVLEHPPRRSAAG